MRIYRLLFLLSILSSCGAVQGYKGPPLPPDQVAMITFQSSGYDYEVSFSEKKVDDVALDYYERVVTVLPGRHSVNFKWSFETADEDNDKKGAMLSWEKKGDCALTFSAEAGKSYRLTAHVGNPGSWASNPQLKAEISVDKEKVAEAICNYEGRSPSGLVKLEF